MRLISSFIVLLHLLSPSLANEEEAIGAGRRKAQRERLSSNAKISGGAPAGAAIPFLVALYDNTNPGSAPPVCLGSLITSRIILTAAHCVDLVETADTGRYDFTATDEVTVNFINVESRVHPNYNPDTLDFDYALLRVGRDHESPYFAQLRTTTEIPDTLSIYGWGISEQGGDPSSVLVEGTVTRIPTADCQTAVDPSIVTSNMFCALDAGVSFCDGDTGGPIVVPGTNVQIGLASWNLGCSGTDTPGVYARVDTAFSWIEQTICTDGFHTDACTADGKLPAVGVDGVALEQSCDDVADFVGHGKKLKTRDCAWVGLRPDRRCQWYGENYCPATCLVDRCKIP